MRREWFHRITPLAVVVLSISMAGADTYLVKSDSSGDYPTIQAAITAAAGGDIIQVEDGTYTGNGNRDIDFLGKAITVRGNVTDPSLVVIDCQGTEAEPHRGFKFINGEASSSILEGLTITNGYGLNDYMANGIFYSVGGAVYCSNSNPTIKDCNITGNSAGYRGGGIFNYDHACPIIRNCSIEANSAGYLGGGIHNLGYCNPIIDNSLIKGNLSSEDGGGISNVNQCIILINDSEIRENVASITGGGIDSIDTDLYITNSIISDNSSEGSTGGVFHYKGILEISNSIIVNNSDLYVGGIYASHCNLRVVNCTISKNSPGGIYEYSSLTAIVNSILWNNTTSQLSSSIAPSYSCIQNWTGSGISNINDSPLFIDIENDDYLLSSESPCINAGDMSFIFDPNEFDIDGNLRVVGGRIDMGASEVYFGSPYIHANNIYISAYEKRENPDTQLLTISNLGIDKNLQWSLVYDCPWLTLDKTKGEIEHTVQDEVNVIIDITGLSQGNYACDITLFDPNAVNSPKTVQVDLDIIGPAISFNSNIFSFTGSKETQSIESQMLTIQNPLTAGGTLNWQIDIPVECQWLIAEPMSGQSVAELNEIILSIDPTYAEYGINSCQFTVSDPNASNSPQVVTVTLDVLRPGIGVTPASILFERNVDEPNILSQTLSISNVGHDTLNWEITEDCLWLTVSPSSGQFVTGPNEVTLTVDPAGLDVATYNCEMMITDNNASNNPVTVPVSLHVHRTGEQHVPIEYATIQAAINAAVDGDHVIVHPGVYTDYGNVNFNFYEKKIVLRSVEPVNPKIVESTIISSPHAQNWIRVHENENQVVIDGLTFKNYLTGVVLCTRSNIVVKNCVFRDNYSTSNSVIRCSESSAVLENCRFINNSGMSIVRFYGNDLNDVIIKNCLFAENTIYGEAYPYGAYLKETACIYIGAVSAIEIENCTIAYNHSINIGEIANTIPAVICEEYGVTFNNCIIRDNHCFEYEYDDFNQEYSLQLINDTHQIAFSDVYPLSTPKCNVSNSNIEGAEDSILFFPYGSDDHFYEYLYNGTLPDPNLIDPNWIEWGPGNIDADPLFVQEPNDGGDGWAMIVRPGASLLYTPLYNNIPGDYHVKSQAGRFRWDGFAKVDFNLDEQVDLVDFRIIGENWQMSLSSPCYYWHPWNQCDLDRNCEIGLGDLVLFCEDYLQPRVFGAWVTDDVTSPCIDAGDPNDLDWQNELWPHGGRVNMGAYGGTPQASMSSNPVGNIADLDHDNQVGVLDLDILCANWMRVEYLLDTDLNLDGKVDIADFAAFAGQWLWSE